MPEQDGSPTIDELKDSLMETSDNNAAHAIASQLQQKIAAAQAVQSAPTPAPSLTAPPADPSQLSSLVNSNTPPPMVQGGRPAQDPNAPPTMAGRLPNILNLITGLIDPRQGTPAGQRVPSRLDVFENFLGNFMQSMSAGFQNSGRGPGSNLRAFGAAVQAPYRNDLQDFMVRQQAQQQSNQNAYQQAQTATINARLNSATPLRGADGSIAAWDFGNGRMVAANDPTLPQNFREIAALVGSKDETPSPMDVQAYNELRAKGVGAADAFKQVQDMKNSAKPDTSAQDDQKYENIMALKFRGVPITPENQAFVQAYERRKGLGAQATLAANAPSRADSRADKSYQYNSGQLEKIAAPIDQLAARISRLQDSIAQNTPQADALVAPELLSVMAGGSGSGLRMNEAEISRVVGGRSNWESLQAAANKWSTDPNTANSITPNQRQQIRALMSEVQKKVSVKQQALQDAREGLLNSDDPAEHRRIVVKARQAITDVDTGANQPTAGGFDPSKDFHPIP